ncbi:MAG: DEAD/DEAH box helicase family protein [Candidatus Izemoplasmatales bacterium]
MIEKIVYHNKASSIQAVDQICHRCMGKDLLISENNHVYCQECSQNQSMSDFLFLNRYERIRNNKNHQLRMNFNLSQAQLKGQDFIDNCFNEKRQGFLHAVCGAGKTEMTLHTILKALNQGLSIAFVIPRLEIIKQLVKRFQVYLPKSHICGLYQGMVLDESADLYVTTPHQLIKFYHEFDLMIIDEVDAYPFFKNQYLERLVKKSRKSDGVLIYISATFPQIYQEQVSNHAFDYCLIPERYHRKDLVIPEFKKYKYLFNEELFMQIASYQDSEILLLVYFPSIHLMTRYYYFLHKKGLACKMLSSQSKYKNRLLKDFSLGNFRILLTTTLLERGVTFKNCHVFVIEADHPIFDKDTLIQISGRVGRDAIYHQGLLIFYSQFVSIAMKETKRELMAYNKVKNHDM